MHVPTTIKVRCQVIDVNECATCVRGRLTAETRLHQLGIALHQQHAHFHFTNAHRFVDEPGKIIHARAGFRKV